MKEQLTRYHPDQDLKPASATDWERVDRLTDDQIEAAAAADPDAQELSEAQLSHGFRPAALSASRKRMGMSQAEYAKTFFLNLRTLQDWEQGRREPEETARLYLKVIESEPDAVMRALSGRYIQSADLMPRRRDEDKPRRAKGAKPEGSP